MDLVNSVTQNSNNTKVDMENSPSGAHFDGADGFSDGNSNDANNNNGASGGYKLSSSTQAPEMQQMDAPTTGLNHNMSANGAGTAASGLSPAVIPKVAEANQLVVPDYLKAIGMDPRKFWPKKYRFTREKSPGMHNPLSIGQRNFYESNGYLVIDDSCPQRLLDAIKSQYRESSLVSEFLVDKLVAKNGKLLQYVKCFCDERLMLMTHKLVESFQSNEQAKAIMDNKQAQRQQLFRDWIYLPFRPMDKIVCAITAIEPLNNVILVVPGTHRVGQCTISSTLESIKAAYETSQERQPAVRNIVPSHSRELFECSPENLSSLVEKSRVGFKYVNLKAGQTLFYHPGLVHGFSDDLVNFGKRQLASIAYYASADCEYIEMKHQTDSQQQQQKEPLSLPISLAHFGDQDPSDYNSWLNRPRLIQDPKASL